MCHRLSPCLNSYQFGEVETLKVHAQARVEELKANGEAGAYLYGAEATEEYSSLNAFFLLTDSPNTYNLPEAPKKPTEGMKQRYAWSLLTGAALTVASALIFARNRR